jgi:lipoprotein-anchoring transpeptidase ErfK/SrfK
MRGLSNLLATLALGALGAFAVILPVGGACAAAGLQILQIPEQPGYVPTPEEENLPAEFRPQPVFFRSSEPAGTIVIHTDERFLYLVQGNGRAIRYGIGVGRDGFRWQGLLKISRKQEWPDWRPPAEMIKRQPYLPRFMAGGPGNPLGARALYLGDTDYRIHGTNQPQTIGHAVSSGCFRMVNRDVIDLFDRVPVGTKVIVLQAAKS